jgi:hypothetical protein
MTVADAAEIWPCKGVSITLDKIAFRFKPQAVCMMARSGVQGPAEEAMSVEVHSI